MKAMHREIMLSASLPVGLPAVGCEFRGRPGKPAGLASEFPAARSGSASGFPAVRVRSLDERPGGPPQDLARPTNKKRTIYGRAARSPYSLLTLFDYPDPNITSEQREVTNVPLQGLFFMNSDLIQRQADALLARLGPEGPASRIRPPESSAPTASCSSGSQPGRSAARVGVLEEGGRSVPERRPEPQAVQPARSAPAIQPRRRRRAAGGPRPMTTDSMRRPATRRTNDSVATVCAGAVERRRVLLRELERMR